MKNVALLQQLLNQLLKLNPPLAINDKFDNPTKQAVKQFETKYRINPPDTTVTEATWIRLGEIIGTKRLLEIIPRLNCNKELVELFGLVPDCAVIEKFDYPAFSGSDLTLVKNGLSDAKKLVAGNLKNDAVLSKQGIPSIQKMLDGVILEGSTANTFDGRKSKQLIQDGKEPMKTVKTFFTDHKADIGAIVRFNWGRKGTNVMFIGQFYFDTTIAQVRAFIIMHEAVHLVENKSDTDFGQPGGTRAEGSKTLSKMLVDAFFPILVTYKGNLGII